MQEFLFTAWHGKWSWGWGQYEGKPQFEWVDLWYDGPHYCIHLGPLWIELDAS